MDKYQLCFLGSLLIASESRNALWEDTLLSAAPETPEAPGIMLLFVKDQVEWRVAKDRCAAVGGWLWAPNADDLAKRNAGDFTWTGWRRVKDQQVFTDTQGNELPQDSEAWGAGEPHEAARWKELDETACAESNARHDRVYLYAEECDKKRTFFCGFADLNKRVWKDFPVEWWFAKAYCEKDMKGWLWAPKNKKWLEVATSEHFWTGWNDKEEEGTFKDMQGNILSSADPAIGWAEGEPNNNRDDGGEDCVESYDMRFNDVDCSAASRPFYCEIPLTQITKAKGNQKTPTGVKNTTSTARPNNATPTTTVPKKDKHSGGNQGGAKVEAEVTEATATQVRATLLTAAGVLVFASAL